MGLVTLSLCIGLAHCTLNNLPYPGGPGSGTKPKPYAAQAPAYGGLPYASSYGMSPEQPPLGMRSNGGMMNMILMWQMMQSEMEMQAMLPLFMIMSQRGGINMNNPLLLMAMMSSMDQPTDSDDD